MTKYQFMEGYLEFLVNMLKKFFRIFLFILFMELSRYIGMYISVSYSNKLLLNIMSKYNILINAKPILSNFPFFGELAPYGRTPLIYAISYGDFETVDILINNGADVNITSVFNAEPLDWCLKHGGKSRYKIAKLLVENGANSFQNKDFIISLVEHTELEDDIETQEYKYDLFLNWVNKFNSFDEPFNYEIIYWSVYGNAIDEFLYMMQNYDIDVNYKDSKGQYILIPAVKNRNVEFFKLLINYGATVDFTTEGGKTIENYIFDANYDKKFVNGKYEMINYDDEKNEMIKIIQDLRIK